jgi:hypothetical protein
MDKLYILIAVIIVGGIVDAVWPGFFPALWRLLVLAAAVGLGIFCISGLQGLSAAKAEARRQREELDDLYKQVEYERSELVRLERSAIVGYPRQVPIVPSRAS